MNNFVLKYLIADEYINSVIREKNFDLDLINIPNSSIEERIKFVKRFVVNEKGA